MHIYSGIEIHIVNKYNVVMYGYPRMTKIIMNYIHNYVTRFAKTILNGTRAKIQFIVLH